jgi:predicted amidohydrolase YtcJ
MTSIKNAGIHTFDEEDHVYGSMFIENGRIVQVGDFDIPNGRDLEGKFIIPGFIDSHVHILETGLQKIFLDLEGGLTLEEVFDRLSATYKRHGFVMGFNLEPEIINEQRMPTREELDRVVKEIPVIIKRKDGHSAALNTRGLEIAFGGSLIEGIELERYKKPTGLVSGPANERAVETFDRLVPDETKIEAFFKTCESAFSKGVTTLVAMVGSDKPDDNTCELLLSVLDRLPCRVIPFYQTKNIDRVLRLGLKRIGGCILVDGSFGSRTAALNEDYTDDPGNKGILYFDDQELLDFLKKTELFGFQTALHAIGDRAIAQVINCYGKFETNGALRHRIEHCELLADDLIEQIKNLGLITSVQPAFEHYWGGSGKMYEKRLGERSKLTNPFRKLIDAGIMLCGGSDSPITPIDPLLGIASAINHPNPDFRVCLNEGYGMFTKNGAYAIFMENTIGSLKPGSFADFLVISSDPLSGPDFEILEVYGDGNLKYRVSPRSN